MSGFDILPTWLIPSDATDKSLKDYIFSNIHYPFKYPLISGYIVYEGTDKPYFYPLNLQTITVTNTVQYVNHSGYVKYRVYYGDDCFTMNYPDAAFFNIKKDSQIVMDGGTVIWSNTKSSNHSDRLPKRIVCKSCGKILDVPDSGYMTCSDPYCTSLLYPRIERFCKVLGLEVLSKEQFDKYVDKSEIQIFPDLLLLPEYRDIKIQKNLWEIIFACLPMDVGIDKQWLIKFCNRCNNNYKTVKFYFDNPIQIYTELDMNVSRRFAHWLSIPRNILELDTVVNSSQIEIPVHDKVMCFDGAPIFRNKTIYITGTFKHGSLADIRSILESYSATVVTEFDQYIQCVLVGDIKDGIEGQAILTARELHLPIFNESEFFAKYEIDEDLEKFLF
jgi:NAD-dependent DNA ligase